MLDQHPLFPEYDDPALKWGDTLFSLKWESSSPFDPDLPVYKHNFVLGVAQNIRSKANLDQWVAIASTTHMSLNDFLDLDEFWQQAIFEAVNSFVKDQNKAQQSAIEDMTQKIEQLKPYSSPMGAVPRPNFAMP